ncbi:DUF3159 domain-containing protein [Agromyces seonyuensis]|uniref:DUF3159 domain-containing protein n=1 Tax=Agromyces seonyuensis TaxID=2662446 RepID=A0A6I4NT20_9MICO|nr:DUF3159 domain-containing protein [Agromyces seonyuensis]MWB97340.1 DUF3159 domain-containing protein [Agromyces seonyuensis]
MSDASGRDEREETTDAAPASPAESGGDAASEPSTGEAFREQLAAAAERSGLGSLARDEKLDGREVLKAIGGVRGILEALVPGLVFLIVYTVLTSFLGQESGEALVPSLVASVGLAVVFTVVRLATKSQPTQAIGGLLGVVLSAALALWTGDARDNYVLGFWTNSAYVLGLLISLFVRWPALGLIVGALMGDGVAWRTRPRQYRLAQGLTLLWIGLFGARLLVQVPLYLADNVQALGAMRLLMGVPLYALVLVFTWLIVRAAWSAEPKPAR